MIIIYWTVVFTVVTYLLLKKRNFDLFTLAILFFIYYNLSALLGVSYLESSNYNSLVHNTTYIIITSILIIIALFMIYNDKAKARTIQIDKGSSFKLRYYGILLVILTIICFVLNLLFIDINSLFIGNKSLIDHSALYMISIWSSLILLNIGLVTNNKLFISISSIIILFSLFAGSRAYVTIAILSAFLIIIRSKKLILIKYKRLLLFGFLFALILTVYKEIYKDVMKLDFNSVFSKLFSVETYQNASILSESFSIFSNLNKVVELNFQLNTVAIYDRIVLLIPFLGDVLNYSFGKEIFGDPRFAPIIQSEIHPGIHWGMGSNIWAEMFSLAGLLGVFIFMIIWGFIIYFGNKLLFNKIEVYVFLAPAIIYATFYIHRLDLSLVIGAFKANVFIMLLIYFIFYFFLYPYRKMKIHDN